jgi:Tol biopolymer transport system component
MIPRKAAKRGDAGWARWTGWWVSQGTGCRGRFAEDSGSWSPDGKWILFSNNSQRLFVVHPDGPGLHQISLDISGSYFASEPAWSPDGTKIVLRLFLASTGEQHLYTVRPTGSDLRQLAGTQGSEEFPDWGSHPLAYTRA